jgi:hypothetical protein
MGWVVIGAVIVGAVRHDRGVVAVQATLLERGEVAVVRQRLEGRLGARVCEHARGPGQYLDELAIRRRHAECHRPAASAACLVVEHDGRP